MTITTLHVMIGLPRSGKSTYVEQHFTGKIPVISADQFRLLLHGKRFDSALESEVWQIREIALRALLMQGIEVAIDETNVTRKSRKPIIKLAQEHGYEPVAYVVKTDVQTCLERAGATDQNDLTPVILSMAKRWEDIDPEEGFTKVVNVK